MSSGVRKSRQWVRPIRHTAANGEEIALQLRLIAKDKGFDLCIGDKVVLRHTDSCPAVVMARGNADVQMVRGNFAISDKTFDAITPQALADHGWRS
jgi:alpha-glucosidase